MTHDGSAVRLGSAGVLKPSLDVAAPGLVFTDGGGDERA